MRIIFLHPDLGIGGAERLAVDTALAAKKLGHQVSFLTNHHDHNHSFPETNDGSFDVHVVADWFPRKIFNKFYALCAYLRFTLAVIYWLFFEPIDGDLGCPDVIFCDQISAPIPLIRWLSFVCHGHTPKVIFYCHYPDMLLTTRSSFLKSLYRRPLDLLEEITTGCADCILVNSQFTESVFRSTFRRLSHIKLSVLYPTCNLIQLDQPVTGFLNEIISIGAVNGIFLSINRYERKKNLPLAIKAAKQLVELLHAKGSLKTFHLIMAGGYDDRVDENVQHFAELQKLVQELNLSSIVTLLKSPSDEVKHLLLHSCTAVLYTPENEHFGIVPLEAMYMSRPVIACASGGPTETIIHKEVGYLCSPTPEDFAEYMLSFLEDKSLSREMGQMGRKNVIKRFSVGSFRTQLKSILDSLVPPVEVAQSEFKKK